ncbi:hypothetical protein CDL15_Pgr011163 [Punica granatum]|uniref:Uncharacterized protein n=1 Tax=Punica granatum TaxID=22663 RepID=A0A218WEB9_PUNGR|nr:hypothetical protein CDL15_Pgr011163 [Punica granatum]
MAWTNSGPAYMPTSSSRQSKSVGELENTVGICDEPLLRCGVVALLALVAVVALLTLLNLMALQGLFAAAALLAGLGGSRGALQALAAVAVLLALMPVVPLLALVAVSTQMGPLRSAMTWTQAAGLEGLLVGRHMRAAQSQSVTVDTDDNSQPMLPSLLEEFKKSEERLLAYAIEVETSLKAIEAKLSFSEHRIAELKAEVEARKKEAAQLRLEKDNALHELERVFAATADAQEEAPEERRKAVEEAVAFC